ncbi:hypothetical protein HELRODRAFT_191151 [Helobdella robusta]|uniref:Uncharacterized protein n=1 Tax=Helobdella robusta TaxID=6412 RepID=T1FSN4_HELRO|nr:hypothetical protein HELRODRAFT_191151 [Helobdella robusta]ESO07347.1 hypothetical protein HELRODRAFT_191151 [Helobdella robusta]
MSAPKIEDDDVDFETDEEEEVSEYEEVEYEYEEEEEEEEDDDDAKEDGVKTVTVKLQSNNIATPATTVATTATATTTITATTATTNSRLNNATTDVSSSSNNISCISGDTSKIVDKKGSATSIVEDILKRDIKPGEIKNEISLGVETKVGAVETEMKTSKPPEPELFLKNESDAKFKEPLPAINKTIKSESKIELHESKLDSKLLKSSVETGAKSSGNITNDIKINNAEKEDDEVEEILKSTVPGLPSEKDEARIKTSIKKKIADANFKEKNDEKINMEEKLSNLKFVGEAIDSKKIEAVGTKVDEKDKKETQKTEESEQKVQQQIQISEKIEQKVRKETKLFEEKEAIVEKSVSNEASKELTVVSQVDPQTSSNKELNNTAVPDDSTKVDNELFNITTKSVSEPIKPIEKEKEPEKIAKLEQEEKPLNTKLADLQNEFQRFKSKSPVSDSEKKEQAGRIEQTRNYLKALTPSEDDIPTVEKEQRPKFEITQRDDATTKNSIAKIDSESVEWEAKTVITDLENEDSDFTYRRKSMDDFIKKILAEAREEKEKENENKERSKKPPIASKEKKTTTTIEKKKEVLETEDVSVKASKEVKSKALNEGKKSKNTDAKQLDVDKELEEINNYFSKKQENSSVKASDKVATLNEEDRKVPPKKKLERQKIDKDPKENGFANGSITDEDIERLLTGKNRIKTFTNDYDLQDVTNVKKPSIESHKKVKQTQKDTTSQQNGHDHDDETASFGDYLSKFKRDRQALFGGERRLDPEPVRTAETEELIRDRTRNIRSVIDQQSDICENVKSVSKQLEELERELREVRQISLERRGRLDALENAVNAEYKMFEIEHNAANERTKNKKPIEKFTQEVKDQMISSIQSAKNKKGYRGEAFDDLSKRRVASISSQSGLIDEQDSFFSLSPYQSYAAPTSRGRGSSSDRDYLLGSMTFDRRRDSSSGNANRNRLSITDNDFESNDSTHGLLTSGSSSSSLLGQMKPRSRASVATMDTSTSISADDFLAKIRNKYSFLNPSSAADDRQTTTATNKSSTSNSSYRNSYASNNGYEPSSSSSSSSFLYSSYKGTTKGAGSNTSDISSILGKYSSGKYSNPGSGSYDNYGNKSKRALSVSDIRSGGVGGSSSIHYDRNLGGYTTTPSSASTNYRSGSGLTRLSVDIGSSTGSNYRIGSSSNSNPSSGGEFKSRFLDKVREKKSAAMEHSPGTSMLADRVRARISSASQDLPSPPSRTKPPPQPQTDSSGSVAKQQEQPSSPVLAEA